MHWSKHGLLFVPSASDPDLCTHAANPAPLWRHDDVFRIFYNGRNAENRSSIGFVDVDIVERRIIHVGQEAVFRFGSPGAYYADGLSIGNFYQVGAETYLLFMGWQRPPDGHWFGTLGRLQLQADFSLRLYDDQPMLDAEEGDGLSFSYPCASQMDDGSYRLWYGATQVWDAGNGEMLHPLHHAHSNDGERWQRRGQVLPVEIGSAQAFSHPSVLRCADGRWLMWYSCRGASGDRYRIDCVESHDGDTWLPRAELGLAASAEGWDAAMVAYPSVFGHRGRTYMLYNGNGFGQSGFGLAELIE